MVLGIQIVGVLFGITMIYMTFVYHKKNEFSMKEFGLWLLLWFVFIFVTLFPTSLDFIVKKLSISRPLDLLIIGGFMFLITISFFTYSIARKTEKRVEEVVRKVALKKDEK